MRGRSENGWYEGLPGKDIGYKRLFVSWSVLLAGSIWIWVATGNYFLLAVPAVLLLAVAVVADLKKVFFLLVACVPLSTEMVLPNGFGTDIPTEPLMIGLMGVALVLFLGRFGQLRAAPFKHPITVLLLVHIFWVYFTTLQSDLVFTSLKFSLAKTWYVAVFYFLALYLLQKASDFRTLFWWVFWPLVATVAFVMVRHAGSGFAFDQVHKVLHPFQRNHVSYAATIAWFMPIIWYLTGTFPRRSWKWILLVLVGCWLLVADYLSYTRAAYVALMLAAGSYFLIRLRLMRVALGIGLLGVIVFAAFLLSSNRYLDYAPNYDTTTSHQDFGNLLEATAKGEDISTMERVYRWVAAIQMSQKSPITGFGPGNFVAFYQSYAVSSFRTYVSRNEEKSGVHSYFLLLLVEQGWPGLFFFLALSVYIFWKGEAIYHSSPTRDRKRLTMGLLMSLVVIYAFLIINDMIETDKVGTIFFLCVAGLVRIDLLNQQPELLEQPNTGQDSE